MARVFSAQTLETDSSEEFDIELNQSSTIVLNFSATRSIPPNGSSSSSIHSTSSFNANSNFFCHSQSEISFSDWRKSLPERVCGKSLLGPTPVSLPLSLSLSLSLSLTHSLTHFLVPSLSLQQFMLRPSGNTRFSFIPLSLLHPSPTISLFLTWTDLLSLSPPLSISLKQLRSRRLLYKDRLYWKAVFLILS